MDKENTMNPLTILLFASLILMSSCIGGASDGALENLWGDKLRMANTVDPILNAVCGNLCTNSHSTLVYKREELENCISGMGNVYYCRCYKSTFNVSTKLLTMKILRDVKISELIGRAVYSCIDERELMIPYYDQVLAEGNIGDEFTWKME